ncbi:MAG: SDR family oxidoreductase [Bacteroidetes bacterium]|nr:MAG: SDR family oxidoreductase [Bacteroidota bacterium]
MNLDLSGKNALVCGSSKGIGKAAAIELAQLGANITLVARSATILTELTRQLARDKQQHHDFLQLDFTDSADLRRKIKTLCSNKTIHILVNNTGGPPPGPILEAAIEDFQQAIHNHLYCSHILVKAVVAGMRKDGYGRIINIISTSVKAPLDGLGVSNTVRAAMANWSKTLANELGPDGITVNNVLPGFTNTQRLQQIISRKAKTQGLSEAEVIATMKQSVPLRRFADPAEVGAAVAFLASPAAAYITGTQITVDGGRTRSL